MKTGQKIVIISGRPEREGRTNQKIKSAIKRLNPDTEVHILAYADSELTMKALEISPHIIMTFPFTAITTSYQLYILKYLLNCVLVCFRTEGILAANESRRIKAMVGMEEYGVNFVDYEIFWGPETARLIGEILLEQGKISSLERVQHFGCPFFEDYLKPDYEFDKMLPGHIKTRLNQYPREKVIMFVTGFALADYSPEDLVNAGDLVDRNSETFQKDFDEAVFATQRYEWYRQTWIDAIITSACSNPELLFIVKTHPCEQVHYRKINQNPYTAFQDYDNILLVTETIPFRAFISHCSLLFHYGSTTTLESYVLQVPSVFVSSSKLGLEGTRFNPGSLRDFATRAADIADVPSIISQHSTCPVAFERSDKVEKFLENQLEFKLGEDYRPSEKIARFLLSLTDAEPQSILSDDKYLVNIFEQCGGVQAINVLANKAVERVKAGDFQRALTKYLDKALMLAELARVQVPKLQYTRSICLYKTGLIDKAIAAVQQELAVNPQDEQAQQLYNRLQSELPKKRIIQEQYREEHDQFIPKVFAVETFLGCNLKCPECAIGADIITRQKGGMSFEQFKIIADKIRPFCEYLYLHLWGEPLLNKDIFKMIEYASAFTKTNISTHGNGLTEEKAEKLILSGVTDILVSVDGFSQEVYEQYRKGGSVDKALWSLKKLKELNIRYGNKVTIYPQFIVFEHNQHEMELFGEFCHSIGLKPIYKAPYIRSDSRYRNCNNPEYVRPSYPDISSLKQAMRDCKNPKEVFTILLEGTCVMCCYDHNGITNYGNIYEQEVLDIWNSPKYHEDRLDIIEGAAPEYCIEKCLNWTLHQAAAEYTNDHIGSNIEEHSLAVKDYGRRRIPHYDVSNCQRALKQARESFENGDFNEAFDIYEQLSIAQPNQAIEILAEVYDRYQLLPDRSRYSLYQSRSYDFGIKPTDKVLDIGSGHIPLPFATHLADISIEDNDYGRAGAPFKYIDGKGVYECSVERLPFGDKEFDFVYCSHVLEHVDNPEKACSELMRIAKRGYIETPTKAKDLWLNSAKVSNHKWTVEKEDGVLVFSEYRPEELGGLGCGVLMEMHCRPETKREKAFSVLIYLKAELFNTMLLWEDSFEYRVRRSARPVRSEPLSQTDRHSAWTSNRARQPDYLETQVHNENKILTPVTRKIDKHSRIQVIGTKYGSCAVVLDIIPPGSTVVSAGVGEDITFDRELIRLKNCKIIGIDPTEKARRYIENSPNENFYFQQKALYCEGSKRIKIYKNTNPDYVSESITPSHNMVSASEFYEAETISIPELLDEYPDVSLLKLDIEGAEYEVLTSISKPDIPQIYVEFHHFCTDYTPDETIKCIEHLNEIGYVIVYGVNQGGALKDVTFVHHKYINEEDIVQMNVEEMKAVKC